MVTAASAVLDKENKLRGVAGVDIPMTDLVSDVQYFSKGAGSKSYAFLFHTQTGVALSHPILPTPETITEDANTVNILELEQGEEFKELFMEIQKSAVPDKPARYFLRALTSRVVPFRSLHFWRQS